MKEGAAKQTTHLPFRSEESFAVYQWIQRTLDIVINAKIAE